jgi:TrmH family RNA methyltransferase
MTEPGKSLIWYRELTKKKGRLDAGVFLVEGDRAIRQVMGIDPGSIVEIVAVNEPSSLYHDYPVRRITESQFTYISSTRTPQGILAVVRIPEGLYSDELPEKVGDKILLLEDIQDPGNTGTIIRTAAAFGFSGVILTEDGADPLSPKCVQATAGSVLSVWIRRTSHYLGLIQNLKKQDYTVIAADINGPASPEILREQQQLLLALGNEAAGLSEKVIDLADYRLRIPTVQTKAESLNVAICGAILMYLSTQVKTN